MFGRLIVVFAAVLCVLSAFACKPRGASLASDGNGSSQFIPVISYNRGEFTDAEFASLLEAIGRAIRTGTSAAVTESRPYVSDIGSPAAFLLYTTKRIDEALANELKVIKRITTNSAFNVELMFVDRNTKLVNSPNPVLEDIRTSMLGLFWMGAKFSGSATTGSGLDRVFSMTQDAVIVQQSHAPYEAAANAYRTINKIPDAKWLPIYLSIDMEQVNSEWLLQTSARVIPAPVVMGLTGMKVGRPTPGIRLTTFDYTGAGSKDPAYGPAIVQLSYSHLYRKNAKVDIYAQFGNITDDIRHVYNCSQSTVSNSCVPDTKLVGWRAPTFNAMLDAGKLPLSNKDKETADQLIQLLGEKQFIHFILNRVSLQYAAKDSFTVSPVGMRAAVIFGRGDSIWQLDDSDAVAGVQIYQRLLASSIATKLTNGMKIMLNKIDAEGFDEMRKTLQPLLEVLSVNPDAKK